MLWYQAQTIDGDLCSKLLPVINSVPTAALQVVKFVFCPVTSANWILPHLTQQACREDPTHTEIQRLSPKPIYNLHFKWTCDGSNFLQLRGTVCDWYHFNPNHLPSGSVVHRCHPSQSKSGACPMPREPGCSPGHNHQGTQTLKIT